MTRIALGGGGDAAQSLRLDLVFAAWIGSHGRLLYIPNALGTDSATVWRASAWINETFGAISDITIDTRTCLDQITAAELRTYDGVYIGGGNTYELLSQMVRSGLLPTLRTAIRDGLCAYGGSAGAAVLGLDIGTVSHLDENTVGITDTAAADVVGGHAVWVHYTNTDDRLVRDFVRRTGNPVIAVSEDAGAVYVGGRLYGVGLGHAGVYHSSDGQNQLLPPFEGTQLDADSSSRLPM